MMLVLGGTSDARELARALREAGYPVQVTTVTDYAGQLAAADAEVRVGALDRETLGALACQADAVIDATHPFATAISRMAIDVCSERNVPYVRFERNGADLPKNVLFADCAEQAAEMAVEQAQGGVIFLTVGSKTLATYLFPARAAGCRVVARVLPTAAVFAECEALGLQPRDIIAMQGPTSAELDAALLRHLDARVIVTKESGTVGGVMEKVRAAEMTGVPIIIVRRPQMTYPCMVHDANALLAHLREVLHVTA